MKEIILLAAIANNGVVGNNNALPWHLKADLKHFKKLTTGKPIVMGRMTYESIGKPLPNRTNIVLSKEKTFDGCTMARDAIEALREAYKLDTDEIYIIGGPKVWKEFQPFITKAIITQVPLNINGTDKFIMEGNWRVDSMDTVSSEYKIHETGETGEIEIFIKTMYPAFGTEK